MKKTTVTLIAVLTINMNYAFQGSQLIQKDYMQPQSANQFLDAARSEYSRDELNQQDLEEYDQHNCDTAHPHKPSAITALFTEIFGFMLMRYITIREIAHVYFHEVKELV